MPFSCIHCKSEVDPKYKACPYCGELITDFLRAYADAPIDGKYQLIGRLGVGGMGEVYKVLHVHLNAIRVVKLMRSTIATDAGAHERFLREARLATKIHHPNVAALYDFATLPDGTRYMVWEYIEGINLHELIDERGPLSPRYAAKLAAQALHGLEAIHRAGIVHRDVSPENLMITRDDEGDERVKIIDLGIAKGAAAKDEEKTKTGMFVGKWKYCSPEHLGMLPHGERIDGRADIYSFGIVLYEMLTGVPPFQADTPHAYLMKHASEKPKPMQEVNPSVTAPPELEGLILRALEKDRTKRFASAREFAQALERIGPELSETPGAPPPLPSTAEITDNATRVAADRAASDAMTVRSFSGDSPTVMSMEAAAPTVATQAPAHRPLDRPTIPMGPPVPEKTKSRVPFIAIAAVLAIVIAIGAMMMRRKDAIVETPREQVPVAVARLGINAFPWANVTSIRNVENGQQVDLRAPVVTPEKIELAPGRYEVTLSNPNFREPITRTVAVELGRDETLNVQFTDPQNAALPDFGGAR